MEVAIKDALSEIVKKDRAEIVIKNSVTGNEYRYQITESTVNAVCTKIIRFKGNEKVIPYTIGELTVNTNFFGENYGEIELIVKEWRFPTDVFNSVWWRIKKRRGEPYIKIELL